MDAEHYRLRDFLTRTAQPYEWHEAGSAEGDLLLESLGLADATLPILVDVDRTFTGATVEMIAAAWGGLQPPKRGQYKRDRDHHADQGVEEMQVALTARREERRVEHDLRQQGGRDSEPGGDEDHHQYGRDLPPVRPQQPRDARDQASALH